jgi:hypothetical protein
VLRLAEPDSFKAASNLEQAANVAENYHLQAQAA